MTPEEIQSTIQQMLSVQRQIQESQIRNTDNIARLEAQTQENSRLIRELARDTREDIAVLVEEIAKLTVDQREKFNQFYGYHIAADSERVKSLVLLLLRKPQQSEPLNIIERLKRVEQEVEKLKEKLDERAN